jgi:hypothetical protein
MKKMVLILSLLSVLTTIQVAKAQATFDKGDVAINLGVGIFALGGNASFEYGIQKNFGVGAYFGYERPSTGLLGSIVGVRYSFNRFNFGVRGAYHFNEILNLNNDKVDFYGAAGLGVRTYSYPYDYYYYADVKRTYVYPQIMLRAGARFFFSEKTAGWAEIGSGGSWIQGGIALKL